jgi:hypothetical protein
MGRIAALGHAYAFRRRRLVLLAVAGVVGVAGCGTHSPASLDKLARSVPTPPGLTFTGINDQTEPQALGPTAHQANAEYTYPPVPCSQLRAEWVSALKAARWTIDTGESTSSVIWVKRHGYQIIVNLGDVTTCDQSIVNVR